MENVNRTLILNDNYVDDNFEVNDTLLSTTPSSSLSGDDISEGKTAVPPSLINAENYFNISEEGSAFSSIEDLERAVQQCKDMVLENAECSDERKWLVRRLIELRFRLQESLDAVGVNETNEHKTKVVLGHHFVLQSQSSVTTKLNCDSCSGIIWSVLHSWYQCTDCHFNCHVKCLAKVCRLCAHVRVSENPTFIYDICPEVGLSGQAYKCAECKIQITFISPLAIISKGLTCFGHPFSSDRSWTEPRRCDYDGLYYCPMCHWNNLAVIPARVVQNWDFEERSVSRASLQVLSLMARHPSIRLLQLNPQLFNFVEELGVIRKIREDLLVMKKYLVSCKDAVERRLLWQLKERQHMMETADTYSLQDLIDVNSGQLLLYLNTVQAEFVNHIKSDCKLCFGHGYVCELCKDEKVIFPFDSSAMSCKSCTTVFHKTCWARKNQQCQKCVRLKERVECIKSSSSDEGKPLPL